MHAAAGLQVACIYRGCRAHPMGTCFLAAFAKMMTTSLAPRRALLSFLLPFLCLQKSAIKQKHLALPTSL